MPAMGRDQGQKRVTGRGSRGLNKSFTGLLVITLAASIGVGTVDASWHKKTHNLMAQANAAAETNTAIEATTNLEEQVAEDRELAQESTTQKHHQTKHLSQTHTHHHKAKGTNAAQTSVETKTVKPETSLLAQLLASIIAPGHYTLAQENSAGKDGHMMVTEETGMAHWLQERPYLLIILAIANVVGCCFCSQILLRFSKQCNLELNRYYIKKRFEKQKMMTNTIQQTRLLRQQQNRTRRLQEERGGQLILEQDEYADEPDDRGNLELDLEPNIHDKTDDEEEEEEE